MRRRFVELLAVVVMSLLCQHATFAVRLLRRRGSSARVAVPSSAAQPSSGPGGDQLTAECRRLVIRKMSPEKQLDAMECESEKGFEGVAVAKLQAAEEKAANAAVARSLEECLGLTQDCAEQLSPGVVLKMRFAGLAVTPRCAQEMQDAQMDQARMARSKVCETEGAYPKQMVEMLRARRLEGAVGVAEKGLVECVGLQGEHCAWQIAPVIVAHILQQASQKQPPTMPLLFLPPRQNSSTLVLAPNTTDVTAARKTPGAGQKQPLVKFLLAPELLPPKTA